MAEVIEIAVKVDLDDANQAIIDLEKAIKKLGGSTSKVESEQKTLGKELANSGKLSQALSKATGGLSDSFGEAVKGINMTNISLKGMKAAIMSTGFGVLVILLGELVTILADLISSEKKSEEAIKRVTFALDEQSKAFDENTKSIKFNHDINLKYAKANGESKEQLMKRNEQYLESEKKRIKTELQLLESENLAILKNSELTDEARQQALDKIDGNMQKLQDMFMQNSRDKANLYADAYVQEKADEDTRNKERIAKQKAQGEKERAEHQAQKEALKALEKRYAEDIENIADKTEQQKLDRQKQRALKELEKLKLSQAEKANALQLLNADFALKQEALELSQQERFDALKANYEKEKADLQAKTLEDKLLLKQERDRTELEMELSKMVADDQAKNNLRKELEAIQYIEQQELRIQREEEKKQLDIKNAEDQAKLDQEEIARKKAHEEAKAGVIKSGFDVASSLSTAFLGQGKKAQAIQKGLTLTQIGIDTANAFSKLMAGSEASAVATGPAYSVAKPIFYATGLIQILANVAKAKAALSSSGASGGGGGGGATPTPPPVPSFNVIGAQGSNQLAGAISDKNSQPLKAFVVANDVTTQQRFDSAIVNNASLG